jgi:WXXGXW repeat (2 copies)
LYELEAQAMRTLLIVVVLVASACVVRVAEPGVPVGAEIVTLAPPAEQLEVVGLAPSPNHLWIRGHWAWHGRWVWEPGFWEVMRPGHRWLEGHWVAHRHGWAWVPGRWVRL